MKKILLSFWVIAVCSVCSAEITIAENGKAHAGIVIPENAKPVVKFAAEELKNFLEKMTGGSFPVGTNAANTVNFYLGFGNADHFQTDEYAISIKDDRIDIYGRDTSDKLNLFNLFHDNPDKGTLHGVYGFLDLLGIRWPAPGEKNAFIPKKPTLKLAERKIRKKPFFQNRQIAGEWNFMQIFPDAKEYIDNMNDLYRWGIRNGASTRNMVPGCHSERSLRFYENGEWLAHPERWQLKKDGTRCREYSCWTDPGTKAIWLRAVDAYFSGKTPAEAGFKLKAYLHSQWPMPFISPDEFMIDPMDHGSGNDGRCYCARCEEFRKKYPCEDDTEILWKFISEIALHVQKKYPGRYISTLVYPPKKLMPKYFRVPANIRVRICLSGPKEVNFPNRLSNDLKLLKSWSDLLGKNNVPLWCYQCASFARTLPGVPDTYPHLTAEYIRKIKPLAAGMFLENHALTHTFRNMDVYIFMRLMWDPSRNVDEELAGYFKAYYGPAAKEAQAFFLRLERNWNALAKLTQKDVADAADDGTGGMWKNKELLQKMVWGQVYTLDEMKKLESMLSAVESAAASDPSSLRRAKLLRKYLFDVMKAERREVMEKEDLRKNLRLEAATVSSDDFPTENEWNRAKPFSLISAVRMNPELKAGGIFRLLASKKTLFIRIVLQEPDLYLSATNPAHENGNPELWKDNNVELFFYAVKTKRFWQIIVNDHGQWSSQTRARVLARWEPMRGLRVKTSRESASWSAEIAIPLSELKADDGELRFNLCRERNIKGRKTEFSTWSPLAMLGNWHQHDNYGTLRLPE